MDESSRAEFDRIRAKTPDSLTPAEIDFLYARRSYFNKSDRSEFADVIKKKDAQVVEALKV